MHVGVKRVKEAKMQTLKSDATNNASVGFYVLKLIICKQKHILFFNKVIIDVYSVKIVIE